MGRTRPPTRACKLSTTIRGSRQDAVKEKLKKFPSPDAAMAASGAFDAGCWPDQLLGGRRRPILAGETPTLLEGLVFSGDQAVAPPGWEKRSTKRDALEKDHSCIWDGVGR